MLAFLFLRYLSDNYEQAAKHNEYLKELGLSPLPTQATENPE